MTVSVLMPVARTGSHLREAVASVLSQDVDVRVIVGVEPTSAVDPAWLLGLASSDPRIDVTMNPEVMGWAENIGALTGRVDSEFFAILPHDDAWVPGYAHRLVSTLRARPDAAVAYGDMHFIGDRKGAKQRLGLTGGDRLMRFFLDGAEAVHWRGIVRTQVLDEAPFPLNPPHGFAVEAVWARRLLECGDAARHEGVVYRKRINGEGVDSVTRRWGRMPLTEKRASVEVHEEQMREGLNGDLAVAADLALARRRQLMAPPTLHLGEEALTRLDARADGIDRHRSALRSRALTLIARRSLRVGDVRRAIAAGEEATELDPNYDEATATLAAGLLAHGQVGRATVTAQALVDRRPDDPGHRALLARCRRRREMV